MNRKISFFSAVLAAALLMASISEAAVFTVNKTDDTDDGVCDADCSYREAIREALIDTQATGNDGIVAFAIPGDNPHVIDIDPGLPTLSLTPNGAARLIIDGSTQPGFAGDPVIFVNGGGLSDFGFLASGGPTTIRSMGLFGFREAQMTFTNSDSNVIEGCWVGLDDEGTAVDSNFGIYFFNSDSNRIGGSSPQQRNIVGGATEGLIQFDNGSNQNTVFGNYIGVDLSGQNPILSDPDGAIGVAISNSSRNQIGGANAGEGNVISGNDTGVVVSGSAVGNVVQGNIIGANASGTAPLPNQNNGIAVLAAQDTLIGGPNAGEGNLIAYNVGAAVSLESNAFDSVVQGNRIVSNGAAGIYTGFGAYQNSFLGNAISSNAGLGIDLDNDGVTPNDPLDSLQDFPALSSARFDGCGRIDIDGGVAGIPGTAGYTVEFFLNDLETASNREGRVYLGANTFTVRGTLGFFSGSFDASSSPLEKFVTATVTDPDGNTSEFSESLAVIESAPGVVNFPAPQTDVEEGDGSLQLTLRRTCGSDALLSLDVAISDGTATLGSDFGNPDQTMVEFANGEMEKTITIPVLQDDEDESDETFTVLISGFGSGDVSSATVTIMDDDVTVTDVPNTNDGNPSGSTGSGGGCSLVR